MKFSFYIFIMLSIIALFIDSTDSKSIKLSKKKHFGKKKSSKNNKGKKLEKKDQFYIITVENPYTNNTAVNTKQKRDLNNVFIDELVSDIHTLIVENKNTYENTEALEELNNESVQNKKKRSEQLLNEDKNESNFVYKLSSTDEYTALYAYLSSDLVGVVEEMTNVKACEPELKLEAVPYSYSNYVDEVKKDTGWKNVSRQLNSKLHLSLISQGKYDSAFINNYDESYYFPQTAGSGVDVFIIDIGYNFRSSEFTNISNRCKCWIYLKGGKAIKYEDGKNVCFIDGAGSYEVARQDHGTEIADIIGGKEFGAAPKANIYGVVIDKSLPVSDFIAALNAIKEFKSDKKVIVMSYMYLLTPKQKESSQIILMDQLINSVGEKTVFVNCAGNDNKPVISSERHYYPCLLDSVLCIGAIDNDVNDLRTMNTSSYKKMEHTNYGKEVNIYGPGCLYVSYQNYYSENISKKECGTSLSAALAGGVVATIMSDENKGYSSKNMIQKLNTEGIKNVLSGLPSGSNNVFLNNGKHIVYSKNNSYKDFVCGPSAGNKKCPSGYCCSKYGYCGTSDDHCKSGCQSQFGTCK